MNMSLATLASVEQLRTHFALINGSPEAISVLMDPALTPASFAAWLNTAGKRALFEQLIASPAAMGTVAASATAMAAVAASNPAMAAVISSSTGMTTLAASSTAMDAVTASNTAMAAVIASSTSISTVVGSSIAMKSVAASNPAMTAVIASSTAMTAVADSATAMALVAASASAMALVAASNAGSDAVFISSTSRLAIYNSDIALAAFQANPEQVQRQITARGVSANTPLSSFVLVPNGTKVILLRRYYNGGEYDCINWARGSVTAAIGQGPAGGGRNLDTGTYAMGCSNGSYANSGVAPANNSSGNFVSAANGLQRRSWYSGSIMYVVYIPVL